MNNGLKAANALYGLKKAKEIVEKMDEDVLNEFIGFHNRNPYYVFSPMSGRADGYDWGKEKELLVKMKQKFNCSWSDLHRIIYCCKK